MALDVEPLLRLDCRCGNRKHAVQYEDERGPRVCLMCPRCDALYCISQGTSNVGQPTE